MSFTSFQNAKTPPKTRKKYKIGFLGFLLVSQNYGYYTFLCGNIASNTCYDHVVLLFTSVILANFENLWSAAVWEATDNDSGGSTPPVTITPQKIIKKNNLLRITESIL